MPRSVVSSLACIVNAGRTRPTLRLALLTALLAGAGVAPAAHAAGLGKITVLSALGQPLSAEIELSLAQNEEPGSLAIKLASPEAFKQASIEVTPALNGLRFSIERRDSRHVVRVTSTQAVNEPFVGMLLELNAPSGKLLREYNFLLDPPELRKARGAEAAPAPMMDADLRTPKAPAPRSAAAKSPAPSAVAAPAPAPEPAAAPAEAASKETRKAVAGSAGARAKRTDAGDRSDREVQVKRGDTLGSIAEAVREDGISLDQMLVALYRGNPQAFVGKNMNRLRSGQILKVPATEEASAISPAEARKTIIAQASDFNAYRASLAEQVARSEGKPAAEGGQVAGGRITARVQEEAPAQAARDKLTVTRAGTDVAGAGAASEERIAREKAAAEAEARVKALEKNVGDLQRLLELKNKELATRQQQAASPQASPQAPVAQSAEVGPPAAPPKAPATDAQTPVERKPAEQVATNAAGASEGPAPVSASPDAARPDVAAAATQDGKPLPKPQVSTPVVAPSLVDELLANPQLLAMGGLAVVSLVGLGLWGARRRAARRQEKEADVLVHLDADPADETESAQAAEYPHDVPELDGSPTLSRSARFAEGRLDHEARPPAVDDGESELDDAVDPIAEADVYVAYGRDQQAEEILRDAIEREPHRLALHAKLLEILAGRGEVDAFEDAALEMKQVSDGEGEAWEQARAMGMRLDPNNPLYASHEDQEAPESWTNVAEIEGADDGLPQQSDVLAVGQEQSSEVPKLAEGQAFDEAPRATKQMKPEADADADTFDDPVPPLEFDVEAFHKVLAKPLEGLPPLPPRVPDTVGFASIDLSQTESKGPVAAVGSLDGMAETEIGMDALGRPESHPEHDPALHAEMPPEIDFSAISLDLEPLAELPELPAMSPGRNALAAAQIDFEETQPEAGNEVEMNTKLELARAYQEIGDLDGARELLKEVLESGVGDQEQRARAMLGQLA